MGHTQKAVSLLRELVDAEVSYNELDDIHFAMRHKKAGRIAIDIVANHRARASDRLSAARKAARSFLKAEGSNV